MPHLKTLKWNPVLYIETCIQTSYISIFGFINPTGCEIYCRSHTTPTLSVFFCLFVLLTTNYFVAPVCISQICHTLKLKKLIEWRTNSWLCFTGSGKTSPKFSDPSTKIHGHHDQGGWCSKATAHIGHVSVGGKKRCISVLWLGELESKMKTLKRVFRDLYTKRSSVR